MAELTLQPASLLKIYTSSAHENREWPYNPLINSSSSHHDSSLHFIHQLNGNWIYAPAAHRSFNQIKSQLIC
jgi:hypothetical protein